MITSDAGGVGAPAGVVAGSAAVSTVVLVMTDVEGSTRSWTEHPVGMDTAMGRHHAILHGAVTAHGGWRPVDQGEGDAVFAAFESAAAAVAAVVDFQKELAAERWPLGIELKVRVGVHAGEVISRGGNLFGSTVNRCARLRGLGSGGQVLLSAPAFELVRDALPDGVTVIDLGEHRMKDLTRAEHVHQLVMPGLPATFPPLASLDRARHNLPVQTSSFLGRTREIAELVELVTRERLVTIVGFGGMGKTRLALQVAAELATGDGDGVWFIDLSAVTDPDQVPAAIATTLGISETAEGVLSAVVAAVSRQRLLLVLDNLEQLLPQAATVVDRIVRAGSGVRVLATSREPLHLSGEQEFALSALPVPPVPRNGKNALTEAEVVSLSTYDAVRLFIRRASAVRRGFALTPGNAAAIASICIRLDGMPLALELAAARTRSLSPEALLPRLDHALTLLTGGGRDLPSRQQTVRATVAWSYDALDHDDQQLLDRLSVFRGSFTLDAAETICGPAIDTSDNPGARDLDVLTGITTLVDHSLLIHQPGEGPAPDRYTMLVSIHQYATEQLHQTEHNEAIRDRHARYYTDLVSNRPDQTADEEERGWELIEQEITELREALDHLQASSVDEAESTLALRIADILASRGLLTEARSVIDAALPRAAPATAGRIELLLHRASIEWNSGQSVVAASYTAPAVEDARVLGDASLLAAALGLHQTKTRAEAAVRLAEGRALLADLPDTGTYWPRWRVESAWAGVIMLFVDPDWAESASRRSLDSRTPTDGPMVGLNLGYVLLARGRFTEAEQLLAPLELLPDTDPATDQVTGLFYAAMMRSATGDPAAALRDLDRASVFLERVEMPGYESEVAIYRAAVHRLLGDNSAALDSLGALPDDSNDSDPRRVAKRRHLLTVLARESGDHSAAADYLAKAWTAVAGWDARCLDLILACLLERATQIAETDPEEATRLIGLVLAHRGDFIFLHGVDYDTDAMLAGLRSTLADEEVDRILSLAATQELPDSPTWPEPSRSRR